MNTEKLIYISCWFENLFNDLGLDPFLSSLLNLTINILIIALIGYLFDIFFRRVIIEIFKAFSNKTKTSFDDYLVKSNFPKFVAHIIPLLLIWLIIPIVFFEFPILKNLVLTAVDIYVIVLCVLICRSIIRTTRNYLQEKPRFQDKPLESYVQLLMIFAWGIGIFLIINTLTGYSVISLGTLGAASAVLLLIFKDTILGFVASIQVSVNDIVRLGDWITFSKYGADGNVTSINLATVRVQNFDNTFTTIPTYSLISDSFQNWRGMQESNGRRIKRAIYIKQSSIQFLTPEAVENLKKIQLIKPYLEHRERDVIKYNTKFEIDKELLINGRNQTNLGVFRKYADAFLNENQAINKDLFLMVRHLAPTEKGIPIEIYCFSYDKTWVNYEHIQADIFDHLLAAVSFFGLEIFELPTGKDLENLH